jgi:hypothetical protein
MKSGFWQIQIDPKDRYKTVFTVPFSQYEWDVMPFGLKNAPSEFQRIMNDIFNAHSKFCIVYIDDVLIFSHSIDQHFKHLHTFFHTVKQNGLVVSKTKIYLFQTHVRFLGHYICQGTVTPIERSLSLTTKFPDQIPDKTQLQRFLGSLNYVLDYYPCRTCAASRQIWFHFKSKMYNIYLANVGRQENIVFCRWKMEWESPPSILVTRNPNWSQRSGTGTGCVKGRY